MFNLKHVLVLVVAVCIVTVTFIYVAVDVVGIEYTVAMNHHVYACFQAMEERETKYVWTENGRAIEDGDLMPFLVRVGAGACLEKGERVPVPQITSVGGEVPCLPLVLDYLSTLGWELVTYNDKTYNALGPTLQITRVVCVFKRQVTQEVP